MVPLRIAIVGASGGIGSALMQALLLSEPAATLYATAYKSLDSAKAATAGTADESRVRWAQLDASNDAAVKQWLADTGPLDWMINCIGILHDGPMQPEKTITRFDTENFQRCMQINCLPSLLLGKYVLPNITAALRTRVAEPTNVNPVFAAISARVGSIEDNRLGGWYSYRASKSALNMALKCLSIEWSRMAADIRVAALHPGTTDTALSNPFQQNVPSEKLFTTDQSAAYLLTQLRQLQSQASGRFIAFDGAEIPW